jgi:hypothetical protein
MRSTMSSPVAAAPYLVHGEDESPAAARTGRAGRQQIALLGAGLIRYEPTPVVEANRAVAVAEGPAAQEPGGRLSGRLPADPPQTCGAVCGPGFS